MRKRAEIGRNCRRHRRRASVIIYASAEYIFEQRADYPTRKKQSSDEGEGAIKFLRVLACGDVKIRTRAMFALSELTLLPTAIFLTSFYVCRAISAWLQL